MWAGRIITLVVLEGFFLEIFAQASSLQRIGGGGSYNAPQSEISLEPPPYFPPSNQGLKKPSDPLLQNKFEELLKVEWELKYWKEEAPVKIGRMRAELEDYRKQDRNERWKIRAKNDPPPDFPQIPRLEQQIPALEQKAIQEVKSLIQKKARLEMAIQLHDKERWASLSKKFNAGECTPEEIESIVSGKDQYYLKEIFGPPDFAGNTKIFGKRRSYDVLEFRYDNRIKNKYTEKTEDLFLYFYGDGDSKVCIGRKLGSDGTVSIYEAE